MSNNLSTESLLNDLLSEEDGTKRNLRFTNPNDPLEGYFLANQQAETDGKAFFGYINKDGAWYIQRATREGAVITYEYIKSSSGYDFSTRIGLDYKSFDKVF